MHNMVTVGDNGNSVIREVCLSTEEFLSFMIIPGSIHHTVMDLYRSDCIDIRPANGVNLMKLPHRDGSYKTDQVTRVLLSRANTASCVYPTRSLSMIIRVTYQTTVLLPQQHCASCDAQSRTDKIQTISDS